MLNEKLLEVLSHPVDNIVAIVTQGAKEPHVVNTISELSLLRRKTAGRSHLNPDQQFNDSSYNFKNI